MTTSTILIAEPDVDLAAIFRHALLRQGFAVWITHTSDDSHTTPVEYLTGTRRFSEDTLR